MIFIIYVSKLRELKGLDNLKLVPEHTKKYVGVVFSDAFKMIPTCLPSSLNKRASWERLPEEHTKVGLIEHIKGPHGKKSQRVETNMPATCTLIQDMRPSDPKPRTATYP